jgi:hypothetical protein
MSDKRMELYIPKILYPAFEIPLDSYDITVKVPEETGKILVTRGNWIEVESSESNKCPECGGDI